MDDIRLFFSKTGNSRFISHLDLNRVFIRSIASAKLPIWFTQGFHQHAYLVFGQPLPLGMAGLAETLDLRLDEPMQMKDIVDSLNAELPPDIRILKAAKPVHHIKEMAFADYRIEMDMKYAKAFSDFWGQEKIETEKKTKRSVMTLDLKKDVPSLSYGEENEKFIISTVLPVTFGPGVLMQAFSEAIGEPVFCYQTRNRFLLYDQSEFC